MKRLFLVAIIAVMVIGLQSCKIMDTFKSSGPETGTPPIEAEAPPEAILAETGDLDTMVVAEETPGDLQDFDEKGHGVRILATETGFALAIKDEYLKVSVPFTGPEADGFVPAHSGMIFVSRSAWITKEEKKVVIKSASAKVNLDTGMIVFVFDQNPSSDGNPVNIVVDHGSLIAGGESNQWLCPPWGRVAHFAKAHSDHPKGVHSYRFTLEGGVVTDAITWSKKFGWEPSLPYHGY